MTVRKDWKDIVGKIKTLGVMEEREGIIGQSSYVKTQGPCQERLTILGQVGS